MSEKDNTVNSSLIVGSNFSIEIMTKLDIIKEGSNLFKNFESITVLTFSKEYGKKFVISLFFLNSFNGISLSS